MKSKQSPHAARRAGQAPVVTGVSTLVIVLLLTLAHLAAGPLPTAAEAAPAAQTWSSRITPLPARPGWVPRSMKLFYQASWSRWLAAGSIQMSFSSGGGRIEATSETRSKGAVRAIWPYASTTRSRISPTTLIPSQMEHVQTERGVGAEYEADYRNFNRDTYARGREAFDATYAAFKRLLLGTWRRDELAAQEAAE